jgi:hypothetical protein
VTERVTANQKSQPEIAFAATARCNRTLQRCLAMKRFETKGYFRRQSKFFGEIQRRFYQNL